MAALEEMDRFWTVPQIAERCQVSVDCVKHWLSDGLLKRTKFGGSTRISEADFQEFRHSSTSKSRTAA